MEWTKEALAARIDHTNLKADAGEAAMRQLCDEARQYGFGCVCVNPAQVKRCVGLLAGSGRRVAAVAGFPLGQATIAAKVFEAGEAIENGAAEIDYVLNVAALKDGDTPYIEREMREMVALCRARGAVSKVIFENCYLTAEEKRKAAAIARDVRPDFVKTSTGFGPGGATTEDVRQMAAAVGEGIGVKAAGGIRDVGTALAMLAAGAVRIGTSSGVAIVRAL